MSTKSSHPDADLHPVATGLAKQTVDGHSSPQSLKLYSGWWCGSCFKKSKFRMSRYIEVNPYHKPDSLLKLNPRGLVPTLQYDGKPLFESTVICEFLDEAYPNHGPRLLPENLYERARMRIWIDYVTSRILPSFHRFLQYQPVGEEDPETGLQKVRTEFLGHIKEFTNEMDSTGPFFLGAQPSLIDFIIAPWALRLWVFDHFKGGLHMPGIGNGASDEPTWARWRKWLSAIEERKSVAETTSDKEYFLPIYQRYADNTAQSELAKAVRAGRGVPQLHFTTIK